LEVQAKLLHFLQNQTLVRVGGSQTIKVNVRVIFATNQPLKALVEAGQFREDLYYRINVFPILIPPLRERKQDIRQLSEYFAQLYAKRFNKKIQQISPKLIDALSQYHWPGNIRELENILQRCVVLAKTDTLELANLPLELQEPRVPSIKTATQTFPENASLAQVEALWIGHVLTHCQGNKTLAARVLDIDASTLYRKLQAQTKTQALAD
jgi:transcriptional regulator with PAS, ATPase and Fis domain